MSDEVQRLVRKLQPAGPRSFDEQIWPIYVSVVVLCGYLCGVVLSLLRFDDERLHANALLWIAVILVAGCSTLYAVSLLQSAVLRRTLVLSLLLSLILNLSLLVAFAWTSIFSNRWEDQRSTALTARKKQDVIIPEYPLFNEDQQQRVPQEFEKPVETGDPEAEQRIQLTRQSSQLDSQSVEMIPTNTSVAGDQSFSVRPARAELPSAPRQSPTMAKLSRQKLQSELRIHRQPNVPPSSAPTTQPSDVASQAAIPPRKQSTLDAPTMSLEQDEAPINVQIAKLARSEPSTADDASLASLATMKRQFRQPGQLPQTTTPVDVQLSRSQARPSSAEPSSTLMAKRVTSAPDATSQIDLQPKVTTQLDRQSNMDEPISAAMSNSMTRSSRPQRWPSRTDVSPTQDPVAESTSDLQELVATASSIRRLQTDAPQASVVAAPAPRQDALGPSAQAVARARADATPSVAVTLASQQSLHRASQIANRATSTATNVTPAVEAISDASTPAPASEPSRMALSRSSVGVAGVGNAANLERGTAAPDTPVSFPSASAHRARATQDLEQGPSLSPTSPALTRQLRASRDTPRTSMQAQPIDTAMVPGATAPSAQAATAAATLQRNPSNAPAADFTAALGSTDIDLGPTRIAADSGDGRAEGGGQPEIAAGELVRALPRQDSIVGRAEIDTETLAPDATATPAEDISGSDVIAATTTGTNVLKSEQPSGAAGGGASNGELTSPLVGDVRIPRATGHRAETVSSGGTPALEVGGNSTPGRSARGLKIQTATKSDLPSLAGTEGSAGFPKATPLDATDARPNRSSAGLLIEQQESEIGTLQGELDVEGSAEGLASLIVSRRNHLEASEGDGLAVSRLHLGAPRRSRQMMISGTAANVELDAEEFAINTPGTITDDALEATGGPRAALETPRGPVGGSLAVDIEALDEDGGVGDRPSLDAGIFVRNANPDSELVGLQPSRFLQRTRPSAELSTQTSVVTPTKAFRRRVIRKGEELAGERGLPSPKTEAAIELGLVFLSRFQSADGSWSLHNFAEGKAELPEGEEAIMVSDSAATGLSLLAYLGAGYHHRADKYQERIKNGLDFLIQHQKPDGDLYLDQDPNSSRSAWMYSHAIAAIALCEAYGMTQDPELKGPAQLAIDFITESQHPSRGGWRYSPAYGSDTSVTGWMTMALKSGELAGLDVPKSHYDRILHWLDLAQVSDAQPFLFRYNPYAPDTPQQRHGRRPTRAITSVGLLMRLYTGWRRNDPNMVLGARVLAKNPPEFGTSTRPRRDTYYWYYATQVMFHMGGEFWENWNSQLHPLLTSTQVQEGDLAGSWNPQTPIPDRWGTYGGRLYVTTLNLLSLEVFYRHLPLYEDTAE